MFGAWPERNRLHDGRVTLAAPNRLGPTEGDSTTTTHWR